MKKRIFALLLVCALCASFCLPTYATDAKSPVVLENSDVMPTATSQTIPISLTSFTGSNSYTIGSCASGSSITVTISKSTGSGSITITGSNGGSSYTTFGTSGTTLTHNVAVAGAYTVTIKNTGSSGITVSGSIYAYKT